MKQNKIKSVAKFKHIPIELIFSNLPELKERTSWLKVESDVILHEFQYHWHKRLDLFKVGD
jgi:hypothetical protein